MKKLILMTLIFTTYMMMKSCDTKNNILQKTILERSWTHSFEEKTSDEIEIYRPSDYKEFPVSRYRQVFIFHDNDLCEYLALAPNDGHELESGTWKHNDKANIITIFDADSNMAHQYEIVELGEDILRLKAAK